MAHRLELVEAVRPQRSLPSPSPRRPVSAKANCSASFPAALHQATCCFGVAVQQRQRRPFAAGQRLATAPGAWMLGAWMLLMVGLGVATKLCREPENGAESARAPDPPA